MNRIRHNRKLDPIKAYAVVSNRLDSYYTYDNRDGEFMAHAIFPKKKEALKFSKLCSVGYGEDRPKVIEVLITSLT